MRYIGLHVSIAGGVFKSLRRAKILDINAMQIFLKNARKWSSPPYKESEIEKFKIEKNNFPDIKIFAHSNYLINCAASGKLREKTFMTLIDEMNRASSLGIDHIVLHPGNHMGNREISAIKKIAELLDTIFYHTYNADLKILLETTSGMGNNIGYKFEHLRDIIENSRYPKRLGVCFDTSHVYAAGYSISNKEGLNTVLNEFDKIVGLSKINLIHLNDCRTHLGSRIDRHEHIGEGYIGDEGFKAILNDHRLKDTPMILETPKLIGEPNSDVILKDIPMILDKSRKFGFPLSDVIFKDIPSILDITKKVSVSVTDNVLKKGINIFQKSLSSYNEISGFKKKRLREIINRSTEIGVSVSNEILKDSLKIFGDARMSVYQVDRMNLEKIYSLINDG